MEVSEAERGRGDVSRARTARYEYTLRLKANKEKVTVIKTGQNVKTFLQDQEATHNTETQSHILLYHY